MKARASKAFTTETGRNHVYEYCFSVALFLNMKAIFFLPEMLIINKKSINKMVIACLIEILNLFTLKHFLL